MKPGHFDWDYWMTMATDLVLAALGLLCFFSMFYYKAASARPDWNVIGYQMNMNRLAAPLVIALCLLLVLCVPKRVLPGRWLLVSSAALLAAAVALGLVWGLTMALVLILLVSLGMQVVVLGLLLGGQRVQFEKLGFWSQLGSVFIHAGFILFIMDFAMLHQTRWHLAAFWGSTAGIGAGCLLSFYAQGVYRRIKGARRPLT